MQLSDVLTVEGVAASAGIVTAVIQLVKGLIPAIDNGKEKAAALVLSAALVIAASIDAGVATLPAGFLAFVAWLSIAKLATGIYDEVTGQPGSFRGGDSPDLGNPPS